MPGPRRTTVALVSVVALALVAAVVAIAVTRGGDDAAAPPPSRDPGAAVAGISIPSLGETSVIRATDDTGAEVLSTVGEGAVEVVTVDGRFRSGSVETVSGSDGEWTATLSTLDPAGGAGPDLAVEVRPAEGGASSISIASEEEPDEPISSVSIAFEARETERFYGLGQRATGVEHRGAEVENRVLDGPYTEAQIPVVGQVVPPAGFDERPDSTYYPVPWVLSSEGYGVLVDDDEVSRFAFATEHEPDRWSVEVDADGLHLRVFAGPAPADVLAAMTSAVGRQPAPSAPFVLGPWWQPDEDPEAEADRLLDADVPTSVAQTYLHYLPCGDQEGMREATREHTRAMHDTGMAVTAYVNPMVCVDYPEVYEPGLADEAFTAHPDGGPYVYQYFTSRSFDVVQFDFTSDAGVEHFHRVLDWLVEDGYDGWMEDFGEYTPFDAVSSDGTPGTAMHNRYVDLYHAAARTYEEAAPRPLARYTRSGWRSSAKVSPIVWGGDPTTSWGFDGLTSSLHSGLGMGLSGVSTWGSDIGGFFSFEGEELTPELLNRWIELGAFSGVMRLQSQGISIGGGPRAQVLDDDVLPVWRRYAKLRTQLHPYIAGATEHYLATGVPVMRHHILTHPTDERAVALDDQYLFGADLLVAPVLAPGETERELYLPDGLWVDLWASVEVAADGSLVLGEVAVREGSELVTVDAPVGQIPLHLRAGAVVPMLPAEVMTLAPYGHDGIVRLADREHVRHLLAVPGPDWSGPLGAGESMRSSLSEEGATWTLTVDAVRARTYELQASLALLGDGSGGTPCRVTADGDEVSFDWDPDTQVLTASVDLGVDGALVIETCR